MASTVPTMTTPGNQGVNNVEVRRAGSAAGNPNPPANAVPKSSEKLIPSSKAPLQGTQPPATSPPAAGPLTSKSSVPPNTTTSAGPSSTLAPPPGLLAPKASPPGSPGTATRVGDSAPLLASPSSLSSPPRTTPASLSPSPTSSVSSTASAWSASPNCTWASEQESSDDEWDRRMDLSVLYGSPPPSPTANNNNNLNALPVPSADPVHSAPTVAPQAPAPNAAAPTAPSSTKRKMGGPLVDPADFVAIDYTIGSPAKRPAVTPNGSATNETMLNLLEQAIEWCLTLKRVSNSNTVERVREYVINKVNLHPINVRADPPTNRVYISFAWRKEYEMAVHHGWEFGVLDHPDGYDPTKPQGVRYQILYSTSSLDFPDMQFRVAEEVAKQLQVTLMAVVPTANPEICAFRYGCEADFGNVASQGRFRGTIVVPPKGADKTAHPFTPIVALAFTDHPGFVKTHMSNLPSNTDEYKLHKGLGHYAEAAGFSRHDVLTAGVQHKKETGAPTSYGFAYLRRGPVADFFLKNPIQLRNNTITFSKVKEFAPAFK